MTTWKEIVQQTMTNPSIIFAMPSNMKTCSHCGELKLHTDFYQRSKAENYRLQSWCKSCISTKQKSKRKIARDRNRLNYSILGKPMAIKNILPAGHQYLFRSAFGDEIWRDSPAPWNGMRPRGSRPIFIEPPETVIVVRMLADKMMNDEILRHRFDDAEHRLIASAVGAIGRSA